MEPDRVDKNSLAAEEPSQPQENLTLPAIAAKADDLDEIKIGRRRRPPSTAGSGSPISPFSATSRSRRAP
jgi:hypothetical protein